MGLLFAGVLVVVGLVPVLYFLGLAGWQMSVALYPKGGWVGLPLTLPVSDHALLAAGKAAPVLPFIPELPWIAPPSVAAMLDRVHVGLVPAVVGIAVMALGVLRALRHKAVIRAQRQRNEDRVRRMEDYRREDSRNYALDGRREPFIGSDDIDRTNDRRVA